MINAQTINTIQQQAYEGLQYLRQKRKDKIEMIQRHIGQEVQLQKGERKKEKMKNSQKKIGIMDNNSSSKKEYGYDEIEQEEDEDDDEEEEINEEIQEKIRKRKQKEKKMKEQGLIRSASAGVANQIYQFNTKKKKKRIQKSNSLVTYSDNDDNDQDADDEFDKLVNIYKRVDEVHVDGFDDDESEKQKEGQVINEGQGQENEQIKINKKRTDDLDEYEEEEDGITNAERKRRNRIAHYKKLQILIKHSTSPSPYQQLQYSKSQSTNLLQSVKSYYQLDQQSQSSQKQQINQEEQDYLFWQYSPSGRKIIQRHFSPHPFVQYKKDKDNKKDKINKNIDFNNSNNSIKQQSEQYSPQPRFISPTVSYPQNNLNLSQSLQQTLQQQIQIDLTDTPTSTPYNLAQTQQSQQSQQQIDIFNINNTNNIPVIAFDQEQDQQVHQDNTEIIEENEIKQDIKEFAGFIDNAQRRVHSAFLKAAQGLVEAIHQSSGLSSTDVDKRIKEKEEQKRKEIEMKIRKQQEIDQKQQEQDEKERIEKLNEIPLTQQLIYQSKQVLDNEKYMKRQQIKEQWQRFAYYLKEREKRKAIEAYLNEGHPIKSLQEIEIEQQQQQDEDQVKKGDILQQLIKEQDQEQKDEFDQFDTNDPQFLKRNRKYLNSQQRNKRLQQFKFNFASWLVQLEQRREKWKMYWKQKREMFINVRMENIMKVLRRVNAQAVILEEAAKLQQQDEEQIQQEQKDNKDDNKLKLQELNQKQNEIKEKYQQMLMIDLIRLRRQGNSILGQGLLSSQTQLSNEMIEIIKEKERIDQLKREREIQREILREQMNANSECEFDTDDDDDEEDEEEDQMNTTNKSVKSQQKYKVRQTLKSIQSQQLHQQQVYKNQYKQLYNEFDQFKQQKYQKQNNQLQQQKNFAPTTFLGMKKRKGPGGQMRMRMRMIEDSDEQWRIQAEQLRDERVNNEENKKEEEKLKEKQKRWINAIKGGNIGENEEVEDQYKQKNLKDNNKTINKEKEQKKLDIYERENQKKKQQQQQMREQGESQNNKIQLFKPVDNVKDTQRKQDEFNKIVMKLSVNTNELKNVNQTDNMISITKNEDKINISQRDQPLLTQNPQIQDKQQPQLLNSHSPAIPHSQKNDHQSQYLFFSQSQSLNDNKTNKFGYDQNDIYHLRGLSVQQKIEKEVKRQIKQKNNDDDQNGLKQEIWERELKQELDEWRKKQNMNKEDKQQNKDQLKGWEEYRMIDEEDKMGKKQILFRRIIDQNTNELSIVEEEQEQEQKKEQGKIKQIQLNKQQKQNKQQQQDKKEREKLKVDLQFGTSQYLKQKQNEKVLNAHHIIDDEDQQIIIDHEDMQGQKENEQKGNEQMFKRNNLNKQKNEDQNLKNIHPSSAMAKQQQVPSSKINLQQTQSSQQQTQQQFTSSKQPSINPLFLTLETIQLLRETKKTSPEVRLQVEQWMQEQQLSWDDLEQLIQIVEYEEQKESQEKKQRREKRLILKQQQIERRIEQSSQNNETEQNNEKHDTKRQTSNYNKQFLTQASQSSQNKSDRDINIINTPQQQMNQLLKQRQQSPSYSQRSSPNHTKQQRNIRPSTSSIAESTINALLTQNQQQQKDRLINSANKQEISIPKLTLSITSLNKVNDLFSSQESNSSTFISNSQQISLSNRNNQFSKRERDRIKKIENDLKMNISGLKGNEYNQQKNIPLIIGGDISYTKSISKQGVNTFTYNLSGIDLQKEQQRNKEIEMKLIEKSLNKTDNSIKMNNNEYNEEDQDEQILETNKAGSEVNNINLDILQRRANTTGRIRRKGGIESEIEKILNTTTSQTSQLSKSPTSQQQIMKTIQRKLPMNNILSESANQLFNRNEILNRIVQEKKKERQRMKMKQSERQSEINQTQQSDNQKEIGENENINTNTNTQIRPYTSPQPPYKSELNKNKQLKQDQQSIIIPLPISANISVPSETTQLQQQQQQQFNVNKSPQQRFYSRLDIDIGNFSIKDNQVALKEQLERNESVEQKRKENEQVDEVGPLTALIVHPKIVFEAEQVGISGKSIQNADIDQVQTLPYRNIQSKQLPSQEQSKNKEDKQTLNQSNLYNSNPKKYARVHTTSASIRSSMPIADASVTKSVQVNRLNLGDTQFNDQDRNVIAFDSAVSAGRIIEQLVPSISTETRQDFHPAGSTSIKNQYPHSTTSRIFSASILHSRPKPKKQK